MAVWMLPEVEDLASVVGVGRKSVIAFPFNFKLKERTRQIKFNAKTFE